MSSKNNWCKVAYISYSEALKVLGYCTEIVHAIKRLKRPRYSNRAVNYKTILLIQKSLLLNSN